VVRARVGCGAVVTERGCSAVCGFLVSLLWVGGGLGVVAGLEHRGGWGADGVFVGCCGGW